MKKTNKHKDYSLFTLLNSAVRKWQGRYLTGFTTRYSPDNGFTLVEVVLVMTVTAIVFVAVYGLYAHTVKQDMETHYEIMASNLAQEGVEIVRNARDADQLFKDPQPLREIIYSFHPAPYHNCVPTLSVAGVPDCIQGGMSVEVGYIGSKFENCAFGGCAAGTETPFRRDCDVVCDGTTAVDDRLPAGNDCYQMTATCTVSWDSFVNPALVRSIDAVSVMTSWQE